MRRTILLPNKTCLEYGSNKTVLSFVCNLCAVEPVTLRPAAMLPSCCTRIVTFAIFSIVQARLKLTFLMYLHLLLCAFCRCNENYELQIRTFCFVCHSQRNLDTIVHALLGIPSITHCFTLTITVASILMSAIIHKLCPKYKANVSWIDPDFDN